MAVDDKMQPATKDWLIPAISGFLTTIFPTHAFIEICSDLINISVVLGSVVIVFLSLLISLEPTFGMPADDQTVERVSSHRGEISQKLKTALLAFLVLTLATVLAKAICISLEGCGVLATAINHFVAFVVGLLAGAALLSVRNIRYTYGYLFTGADLGFRFRFQNRWKRPPQ